MGVARRGIAWCIRHSGGLLWLSVGVGIGVLIKYPSGWAMSDSAATIVGSLIGALATAAAVVVGFRLQSDHQRRGDNLRNREERIRVSATLLPAITAVRGALMQDGRMQKQETALQIASDAIASAQPGLDRWYSKLDSSSVEDGFLVVQTAALLSARVEQCSLLARGMGQGLLVAGEYHNARHKLQADLASLQTQLRSIAADD